MPVSRSSLILTLCVLAGLSAPASAQDVDALARFYKDKTVTIGIGSSAGGGLDT